MAGTTFSTTLQTLRKNRGVTQEQLATYLGVSPQAVSKWENGSYPDGDLLPQIADYFEVSIDYLYGRAKDNVSIEQQLLETIKGINVPPDYDHSEHMDRIMKYIWAMQLGLWPENKQYFDRTRSEGDHVIVSTLFDKSGFNFFRLNKNLEFFTIMKRPENGFASYFKVTDELTELFAFLGKKENLKVLFYLLSLDAGNGVSVSTIAKRVGISETEAKTAVDYLKRVPNYETGNRILMELSVLDEYDKREPMYAVNSSVACTVLLLLAGADVMIHPPGSYAMSIGGTDKAWLEREQMDFLQKQGKK
ncbi:MAG: helix-turn-helix transcriptional regulator [Lachnospiraceae bacterium]|nr:helix-turn-helix transcriptional regulator [Lachnospiraceae bacterium]